MPETNLAHWLADDDEDLPPGMVGDTTTEDGHTRAPLPGKHAAERTRRWRLWVIAGVAWALVAAVWITAVAGSRGEAAGPLLAGDVAGGGQASGGPGAHGDLLDVPAAGPAGAVPVAPGFEESGGEVDAADASSPGAGEGSPAPGLEVPGNGAPAAALDTEVAAAAVVAVRLALTHHGEQSAQYVDLAVPSGVEWHGDVAVVTVEAVVLHGDGNGWSAPRQVRYAQPVRLAAGGPVPAGDAWAVPAPAPGGPPPAFLTVHEPQAQDRAEAALAAAGYRDIEVLEVSRMEGLDGILVARVEAAAPGEPQRTSHDVWVSEESDQVLGSTHASVPASPPRQGES